MIKKIFYILLFITISSQATEPIKWTITSFEEHCVYTIKGEMTHSSVDDENRTIKCMVDDKEISSVVFSKNKQMKGYDEFKRRDDFVLKREVYNSEGLLENQEIYLPYAKENNLVYFRIDSSGKVIDGHYMIPPESIKIIPTAGIAIDNGKVLSIDVALEKIKKLVLKTYKKDLSRLIIGLNQKQLGEIKDLPPHKEPKPDASK